MNYDIKIDEYGVIRYYINEQLHREHGPAEEYPNGDKLWYKNGYLHREDGPAVEFSDGDKFWFKNGKYHREDGPAVEFSDGSKEWHLNGIIYGYDDKFTSESWKKFIKTLIFS